MDNQQVRLAWLAGIIDGEGTISVEINRRATRKVLVEFQAFIQVVNCDQKIIDECQAIANTLGVNGYVWEQRRAGRKNLTILRFSGYTRGRKVLQAILPYLVGKREQATLFLDIANRRLGLPPKSPYTVADFNAWWHLKELNAKDTGGVQIKKDVAKRLASYLRDYTPGPLSEREDIVRRVMKVTR